MEGNAAGPRFGGVNSKISASTQQLRTLGGSGSKAPRKTRLLATPKRQVVLSSLTGVISVCWSTKVPPVPRKRLL